MSAELPNMPEPNGYIVGLQWFRHKQTADSLSEDPLKVYTADQMRDYAQEAARQAMERAAKVCDEKHIEAAAREDAGGSDIDWSNPANLFATAPQRAAFRRGASWAIHLAGVGNMVEAPTSGNDEE